MHNFTWSSEICYNLETMGNKEVKKATLSGNTAEERIIEWRKTEEYKALMDAAAKAGRVFERAIAESQEYELRVNKRAISPA